MCVQGASCPRWPLSQHSCWQKWVQGSHVTSWEQVLPWSLWEAQGLSQAQTLWKGSRAAPAAGGVFLALSPLVLCGPLLPGPVEGWILDQVSCGAEKGEVQL